MVGFLSYFRKLQVHSQIFHLIIDHMQLLFNGSQMFLCQNFIGVVPNMHSKCHSYALHHVPVHQADKVCTSSRGFEIKYPFFFSIFSVNRLLKRVFNDHCHSCIFRAADSCSFDHGGDYLDIFYEGFFLSAM